MNFTLLYTSSFVIGWYFFLLRCLLKVLIHFLYHRAADELWQDTVVHVPRFLKSARVLLLGGDAKVNSNVINVKTSVVKANDTTIEVKGTSKKAKGTSLKEKVMLNGQRYFIKYEDCISEAKSSFTEA